MKFFTSDLHLGHKNIVQLSHRPFADLDEMHHAIIINWNSVVRHDDDIVYVLGDFTSEGGTAVGLELAKQLRGRKRLIEGNHDRCWMGKSSGIKDRKRFGYDNVFELISPWMREKIGSIKVVMSHFPYGGDHTDEDRFKNYRLRPTDTPILHGHTHSTERVSTFVVRNDDRFYEVTTQVHVGVDAWGYTPVTKDQVVELLS